MRSGRSPIGFERGLVTGARKHLGYLAAKLAPDLGLNRVKNPTKTASPKKSTAERALKTIKKNVTGNDCQDDDPDYADHTSNVGDNDDEDGVGDDDVDAIDQDYFHDHHPDCPYQSHPYHHQYYLVTL